MTWERLGILPDELVEVAMEKSVWTSLREPPDPDSHTQTDRLTKDEFYYFIIVFFFCVR